MLEFPGCVNSASLLMAQSTILRMGRDPKCGSTIIPVPFVCVSLALGYLIGSVFFSFALHKQLPFREENKLYLPIYIHAYHS